MLPFSDLSSERDQEYFCAGLSEELISSLTRLQGLRVASRTSSFQYKDRAVDVRRIGAELNVLQTDRRWAGLVEDVRRTYSGELGYAANWDSFGQAARSVPVDTVGIDAYPRLGLPATATAAQMQLAWRRWLQQTVPSAPGDVPLYELGAAAEAGTVTDPALPHTPGAPLDEGVQARWLGAACRAAQAHGLGGVYLWKMELDADPALADPVRDLHDSWVGRTAETALRQCFADWPAR